MLKINERFQKLHRKLSKEERSALKESIELDGITEPVIVTKGDVIVDGHNRYEIGTELKIKIPVKIKIFKNDDEIEDWILRRQLARRNLSKHDYALTLGRLYNKEKTTKGRPKTEASEKNPQNEGFSKNGKSSAKTAPKTTKNRKAKTSEKHGKTATELAEKTGKSKATVERSGKYAEAWDKLPDDIQEAIYLKPSLATHNTVIKLAERSKDQIREAWDKVKSGQVDNLNDAIKAPKKPGTVLPSAVELVQAMHNRHISGRMGLPQGIDAIAKANGGQGEVWKRANHAINELLKCFELMKKGKQ